MRYIVMINTPSGIVYGRGETEASAQNAAITAAVRVEGDSLPSDTERLAFHILTRWHMGAPNEYRTHVQSNT